jgi:tetratricopeptide (TPR) repeat protein
MRPLRLALILGCAGVAGFWRPAASAASLSSQFDAANKLYEEGKFPEAAAGYQKIIQSGSASGALYFNLGNALFKAGQTGRAIHAYRLAERIDPRDPDLRANLRFVRNQVQGPTQSPNRWQRALGNLTLNEWTGTTAFAVWVWLLLLSGVQLRDSWKPALRPWVRLSGAAAALAGLCLALAFSAENRPSAVVTAAEAGVHNGPLDESPVAFTAHDGAELEVLDKKGDWLQVSVGDRRLGWIHRAQVALEPST